MATLIGDLAVRIGSVTDGLTKGLNTSAKNTRQLRKEFRSLAEDVGKFTAATVAAGAAMAVELTRRGLVAVDAQAKLAKQLGGTVAGLRAVTGASGDAGVSAETMGKAMERLNARIGEAMRGTGSAAESFDRLGLNAEELAGMDVDERIAHIADRMQEMGLSTQEAGDELRQMGIRQGEIINLMTQGGDAIRAEREEVENLGLAISAVDTKQIEMANDAMGVFDDVLQGVMDRLAVEAAPIISAIANLFHETALEAGGFGEQTSDAFDGVVRVIGFGIDAVEGLRRVFEVAGKTVAMFALSAKDVLLSVAETIVNAPTRAVNEMIRTLNAVPTVDIEPVQLSGLGKSIRLELASTREAIKFAQRDIHDTIMEPLPSLQFEAFVAKAREDAEVAAREMVDLEDMLRPDLGGSARGDGGEADEEAKKERERISKRLEAIRQGNLTELEELREKFEQENEIINTALEQQLLTEQEWEEMSRRQKAAHEEALTDIEKEESDKRRKLAEQEAATKQKAFSNMFSNLSTLMNTESRKMFEVGKAAALAGALVDAYAAITGAYKVGASIGGPVLGAAFGAAAGAATFTQVRAIQSQSMGGGGGSPGSIGGATPTSQINQAGQGVSGQAGQGQTMTLQGINPEDMFSGRQLIDVINKAQRDGAILQVAD